MRAVWRADFEAWPLQACGRGVFGREAGDGSSSNFGWGACGSSAAKGFLLLLLHHHTGSNAHSPIRLTPIITTGRYPRMGHPHWIGIPERAVPASGQGERSPSPAE
jgi:hypothetical protein